MILTVKKVGGGQPFMSNMEKKNHMLIVQLKKKLQNTTHSTISF